MEKDNLLKKAKKEGFDSVDDFVKANLHYLPKDKQILFHGISDLGMDSYQEKVLEKTYYKDGYYNGKN